jgi:hypothetical protein
MNDYLPEKYNIFRFLPMTKDNYSGKQNQDLQTVEQ